jgi:mRNA interferase RelE/StbE
MSFSIEYDHQPKKFLKKLDRHISDRIIEKVDEALETNPIPHNAKAIVGKHGVFRIRVGSYRVLYRINYEENKVIVFKIDK